MTYTLPGVMAYLQKEWATMERERILWCNEKEEMKVCIAQLTSELHAIKLENKALKREIVNRDKDKENKDKENKELDIQNINITPLVEARNTLQSKMKEIVYILRQAEQSTSIDKQFYTQEKDRKDNNNNKKLFHITQESPTTSISLIGNQILTSSMDGVIHYYEILERQQVELKTQFLKMEKVKDVIWIDTKHFLINFGKELKVYDINEQLPLIEFEVADDENEVKNLQCNEKLIISFNCNDVLKIYQISSDFNKIEKLDEIKKGSDVSFLTNDVIYFINDDDDDDDGNNKVLMEKSLISMKDKYVSPLTLNIKKIIKFEIIQNVIYILSTFQFISFNLANEKIILKKNGTFDDFKIIYDAKNKEFNYLLFKSFNGNILKLNSKGGLISKFNHLELNIDDLTKFQSSCQWDVNDELIITGGEDCIIRGWASVSD